MGCCSSREQSAAGPNGPGLSRSSGAESPTDATVPALDAAAATLPARRPNAALRKSKPWRSTSRSWTPAQLARERDIFWETQVAGAPQVWSALRLAVGMARDDSDLKGAKAVLDASGCTCPTGRLGDGVWDERGVLYKLPRWVLSNPVNMVEGAAAADDDMGERVAAADDGDDEEDEADADGDEDEDEAKADVSDDDGGEKRARDDKGKGRIPTGPSAATIRARLSDRGTDVELVVDTEQPIRTWIRRIQAEAAIPGKTKVKIAYLGKMLKESESLTQQGWQPGHVLNAMVFQ